MAPDLATQTRVLAQALRGAGFGVHSVTTVTDDRPLPDCEWCTDDGSEHDDCEALIEILHDHGSVHACWHCRITAAVVAAAANESRDGWFRVEVTQRSAT